jgi:hypothetical protein
LDAKKKPSLVGQSKSGVSEVATNQTEKIEIESVNHSGHVTRVDSDMYEAIKRALLKVLPKPSPRLTEAEIRERVITHLPEKLFPQGANAGWWAKAVQLDGGEWPCCARENQAATVAQGVTLTLTEARTSLLGILAVLPA